MNEARTWQRLCELLDDDELIWPAVEEALPDGGEAAWEALVGGLDGAGALAYLDAADTGMELADALAQLPRVFRLRIDLGRVTDTDDLGEALRTADTILGDAAHRLLQLHEPDTDAYALVVVPADSVTEILARAVEVGHRISAPH